MKYPEKINKRIKLRKYIKKVKIGPNFKFGFKIVYYSIIKKLGSKKKKIFVEGHTLGPRQRRLCRGLDMEPSAKEALGKDLL